MLRYLSVTNFALIDHLEVGFGTGLNLITGETGSGKSILVDAVGLLVGARASQEMIRHGHESARVEGIFSVPDDEGFAQLLSEAGIDSNGETCIIRRDISSSGNNRIFVNGNLSTLSFLSRIGRYLIKIHGQHSQQLLLQAANHLEFLDRFGQNHQLLADVRETFGRLHQIEKQLDSLRKSEQERLQRIDLLKFQVSEITGLNLRVGLDSELEEEKGLLSSAEKRKYAAESAYDLVYEREDSIIVLLNQVESHLEELCRLDPSVEETKDKLRETQFQLEELAFYARDYSSRIEFNPARLEEVEGQLAQIEKLKRKYGPSLAEVLDYSEEIQRELDALEDRDHELGRLEEDLEQSRSQYLEAARQLSERRRAEADDLSVAVQSELAELGMEDTILKVHIESDPTGISEKGIDAGEFLISPNPGEIPKPLIRIASGGELSRIMLALEAVLDSGELGQTLIFDEVDSGIGGRTASSLGQKLKAVSCKNQVFCVTHLPQVAGFADHHFHVGKLVRDGRTIVEIDELNEVNRIEELSRMMAGEAVSETTRIQARELLLNRLKPS